MIADSVQEVMELDDESILASPNIGSRYKSQFIQGMVKSGEQFVILLDINTIFSSNDVSMLQELTAPVTDNNNK
jgi:purine-binding chemotaxis protein CheW